ncbi:MFS transporter [Sphingobium lactosutens]|uniref:MFS transporter n=1 Tax=Sphingobium lactosutens TaxID=522773 RepID=UPI0015BC0F08|nr:MFS transporter [Sphingobium lactosutens]NWK98207.1 MFS transporter [Sphingobium lactosutens]
MSDIYGSAIENAAVTASRYRWKIVALLFAATVINYIDRQMIGVLKPTLAADLGWTESDFANVIIFFQLAYAIGYLGFGRVIDMLGARLGYAVAFIIWQLAHIAHGAAFSVGHFAAARFALGIGEAGNFPAAIKAVTEWFPARERAFAIGIFNAGANIGAVITPLVVPIIVLHYGWRAAFVITGVVAFVWLIAWLAMYRAPGAHPKVNAAERAWIEQDPADGSTKIRWAQVIRKRETWAYAIGKFFIDPIWWFFLFWLPSYLGTRYGLDLVSFGPPLAAIYLLSDVGSVAGGWSSSRLMAAGYSVNVARKITMLICALAVLPIFIVQSVDNLWLAVLVIGLATAAHQAFSANLYTLPSDIFPRAAVASVIGIGGTAGAVGGMMMSKFAGFILDGTGSYASLFALAGGAYLAALLAVHMLSPRLARVEMAAA